MSLGAARRSLKGAVVLMVVTFLSPKSAIEKELVHGITNVCIDARRIRLSGRCDVLAIQIDGRPGHIGDAYSDIRGGVHFHQLGFKHSLKVQQRLLQVNRCHRLWKGFIDKSLCLYGYFDYNFQAQWRDHAPCCGHGRCTVTVNFPSFQANEPRPPVAPASLIS
jgi:hypothetical protein